MVFAVKLARVPSVVYVQQMAGLQGIGLREGHGPRSIIVSRMALWRASGFLGFVGDMALQLRSMDSNHNFCVQSAASCQLDDFGVDRPRVERGHAGYKPAALTIELPVNGRSWIRTRDNRLIRAVLYR
jgi:hypothetical protein